jgi:RNA 3'-terminal phosphate cyclase (ATP)
VIPAERLAETAVAVLRNFIVNHAQVVPHLADQLLLTLALAQGSTSYTTNPLTRHPVTNAHLLRQWLDVAITIDGTIGQPGQVSITGANYTNVG